MNLKLPLFEIGGHIVNLDKITNVGPAKLAHNMYRVIIDNTVIYFRDDLSGDDARTQRDKLIEAWCNRLNKPITTENNVRRLDAEL